MDIITKKIMVSAKKPFVLVPISDIHMGNAGCDEKLLKDTVAWIKKKGAYTVILGDHIDAISNHDKRFEMDSIAERFHKDFDNLHYAETVAVVKALKPIKDHIIAAMPGNHEHTVKKRYSFDSIKMLCDALGCPRISDPSFIRLQLARGAGNVRNVDVFCSHGLFVGGGRKIGSKANNLRDLAAGFDADIYLAGHSHQLFGISDESLRIGDANNLISRRRFFINTGSFLRTYQADGKDNWAARKVFMPARIGVMRIDIYPKRTANGGWYPDVHIRE